MYNPALSNVPSKGVPSRLLKTKFLSFYAFPGSASGAQNLNGQRSQFKLPPGAILKSARAIKTSIQGAGVAYALAVRNVSDSITYATFPALPAYTSPSSEGFYGPFNLSVDNIMAPIPASDRVLKFTEITSGGVDPSQSQPLGSDCLIVEYY